MPNICATRRDVCDNLCPFKGTDVPDTVCRRFGGGTDIGRLLSGRGEGDRAPFLAPAAPHVACAAPGLAWGLPAGDEGGPPRLSCSRTWKIRTVVSRPSRRDSSRVNGCGRSHSWVYAFRAHKLRMSYSRARRTASTGLSLSDSSSRRARTLIETNSHRVARCRTEVHSSAVLARYVPKSLLNALLSTG